MRVILIVSLVLVVGIMVAVAGVLAFDAPQAPPPMLSVENAFIGVDFRALPARSTFTARDGTKLVYRAYPGDPRDVVVLVHGSSGTSASMHVVAEAIHARGATVYALGMRGHDGNPGRSGDIDYVGQLDDDVVDFMRTLAPRPNGGRRTLLGFSSGGGFVLHFAGSPNARLFDRFVLVSPQLPVTAPTTRPNAGGWVSVAIPRIVVLSMLSRAGMDWFGGLPVLAMAVAPGKESVQTPVYSYRMLRNFGPDPDYLGDLKRAPGPVYLLAGSRDEIFRSDRYAALLKPVRPDLDVTLVPGLGHMDMTVKQAGVEAIADKVEGYRAGLAPKASVTLSSAPITP